MFSGSDRPTRQPEAICRFCQFTFQATVGRLCQAGIRRPNQVLRYLGRYTHRVAISNHRLLAFDGEHVTFRWKDYAHGNKQRKMTLEADGVPAPLYPAHSAAGLRPHPAIRIPHEHPAVQPAGTCPRLLTATPKPTETCPTRPATVPPGGARAVMGKCGSDQTSHHASWPPGAGLSTARRSWQIPRPNTCPGRGRIRVFSAEHVSLTRTTMVLLHRAHRRSRNSKAVSPTLRAVSGLGCQAQAPKTR